MSVTVEFTYDMTKALGETRISLDGVGTVREVVAQVRDRFGAERGEEFERLTHTAAVAVNGVLVNHRRGMKTPLADGDKVSFVKSASGG